MRIRVRHETSYRYSEPAALGPHIIRLRPAGHTRATVLSYNLAVTPECEVRWQQDPWANRIARVTFPRGEPVEELRLVVDATFDIKPVNPFDFFVDDSCAKLPFDYPAGLAGELAPFLARPKAGPRLAAFLETAPARGKTIDYLVELNGLVARTVGYIIRNEPGIQTSEETLEIGTGSCRDSAVLLVDALRSRGLAARFVSGYLVQLTDEGNLPDAARGVANDVVDLHAWAEVFLPGAGWVGLDGTSGLLCGEGHIPLAGTVNSDMAAPVTGTSSTPATGFTFELDVVRLGHEPRPRKPYETQTWQDIVDAGDAVDLALTDAGLTLTSGGEPTWTSRLHPTEPEWLTEALGPTKLAQGLAMAREIARKVDPGTLAMQRMGKHYPGETMPRWVLHLVWRADGVPVWRDPSRLALGADGGDTPAEDIARGFAHTLARRLGVAPNLVPGYEDPWHFIREEQHLPEDVDPLAADLDDSEERRRLARVLGRGLGSVVGFALPIARSGNGWVTADWTFRRGNMFLLPGESPMGLRMPLDRLGGTPPKPYPQDPTGLSAPIVFQPGVSRASRSTDGPVGTMRTSLCVEPREGRLHVFLPPMDETEWFLELVTAVEDVATELDLQVAVEGYPPPSDPRLRHCLVTPDPGVIEVNLPVCRDLREYTATLDMLTDAALHAGLTTEKFQLDGREVGSGGGNHITLGGPTPLESPWLNRPALLGGLLRYLQNHPALSFLFTGLFVGPTSQAPRVDEARHDALGELELALAQIPAGGDTPPPWLIDRLLRNLLTDVAGNTHRTEVCIDKLYDPNTSTGRQGLVELRGFEMPPHHHMATVQMMMVRAVIARLAAEPYEAPLVRWGTELHDRFMLPHYLWADLEDIVADLQRVELPLALDWFVPFLDHRCPVAGQLQLGDISVEVRAALEPWPALGEQPTGAAVARYVDASLERVQVKVSGMTEGRHIMTVNGVQLPLRATGTAGERVGGVRFRAWQPPFCLQPHIGLHHPLKFDVIDTWGKRSLGGCQYHVVHPEGQGFVEPPLTLFEASARRAQRFTTEGHAPWPAAVQPARPHPEHPYTLDLRLHSAGVRHVDES
jgi:uncharacterized protein (DUF2126 family)